MKNKINFIVLAFFVVLGYSQSIEGKWATIDEKTQENKSIINIYIKDGLLYGDVIKVLPKPGESDNPICDKCTGDFKDKEVVGMTIIMGLEQDDIYWEKDDGILDPEKGSIYDCKMWLEGKDKLIVRGYIVFFFRTQQWIRLQ